MELGGKLVPIKEKKSETLEVRMAYSQKRAFKSACEHSGTTASVMVRSLVDMHLAGNRLLAKPKILARVMVTGATALIVAIGAVATIVHLNKVQSQKLLFSLLDTNRDGEIRVDYTEPRLDKKLVEILRQVDGDGDGRVTHAEISASTSAPLEYRLMHGEIPTSKIKDVVVVRMQDMSAE